HDLMSKASSAIDVCGYSLRNFFDSFRDRLTEEATRNPLFRARLLIVDPSTDCSKTRERAEGLAKKTFETAARRIVETFSTIPNVEVRFLRDHLTTMVFRIDDVMFVGPQLTSLPSKANPTFEVVSHSGGWLFSAYKKEFEQLWDAAAPQRKENPSA